MKMNNQCSLQMLKKLLSNLSCSSELCIRIHG